MAQVKQAKHASGDRTLTAKQAKDLQVHEDIDFQRKDWLAQRIGWGAIALVLLAALAGVTGSGPLSRVTRGDGRYLTVEYERFVRHGARTTLTFRVAPAATTAGRVRIAIDRRFLVANDLQRVVPEPSTTRGRDQHVEFVHDVAAGEALQVRWTVEPEEIGKHSVSVRLDGGPPIEMSQFTYP